MALGVSSETHKVALLFHWLFKVRAEWCLAAASQAATWLDWRSPCFLTQSAAVAYYVFCTLFIDSFITNFIVCVVLIALDFWTVRCCGVAARRE
jgi:hypothetical protein